jgi:predicted NBD/HSP70 family sugar kinase
LRKWHLPARIVRKKVRISVEYHPTGIRHIDLTRVQRASSETARRINRDIVLELIRQHQPTSRAELSRRSGLQRSTVSQIVEQLIRERWVREGPVAISARGRRPTMLGLNEELGVIAIDIRPSMATIAVVDLNGRLLSRSQVPITSDPESSTRQINEAAERVRDALPRYSIEGIGISLPGRVDPVTQRLIFAPNLCWPDFDLKRAVESKMRMPVKMENAANACLIAELTFGSLDGVQNIVLVTISEGVGTGIFANGHLITGDGGRAGEFGHAPLGPDGPRCACGRNGCWEVFASCRAALRYYSELEPKARGLTFHDLLLMAEDGDPSAACALERQAKEIGRGLGLLIAGLAPSMILIAGEITGGWSRFGPVIERETAKFTVAGAQPRILPAHEGEIARLRGAAALVFQRHLPDRDSLEPLDARLDAGQSRKPQRPHRKKR